MTERELTEAEKKESERQEYGIEAPDTKNDSCIGPWTEEEILSIGNILEGAL